MRKLLTVLLVMILCLGCALAETEVEMVELTFPDFTMSVPSDTVGTVAPQIDNNVPFFMFYQDYDPEAAFSKCLNGVVSFEVLDLDTIDPAAYAQAVVSMASMQYSMMGVQVTDPQLLAAGPDEHEGKRALSCVYALNMDYTGAGYDEQRLVYFLQSYVPIEGSGTYTFTLTTDDLEDCRLLMDIMESIRWTD